MEFSRKSTTSNGKWIDVLKLKKSIGLKIKLKLCILVDFLWNSTKNKKLFSTSEIQELFTLSLSRANTTRI